MQTKAARSMNERINSNSYGPLLRSQRQAKVTDSQWRRYMMIQRPGLEALKTAISSGLVYGTKTPTYSEPRNKKVVSHRTLR